MQNCANGKAALRQLVRLGYKWYEFRKLDRLPSLPPQYTWLFSFPKMTSQPTFFPRAEALRGLAALAVVGFHVVGFGYETIVTGLAPVVVFFVLSGFLLGKSLERDPNAIAFIRHRAFRLLPAGMVTVALMTALHWQFGFYVGYLPSFEPLNVVLNALLIKSDINASMWSLTVEVVAIPVILVSHRAFHAAGYAPLAGLAIILFSLSFYGPYVHALGGFTNLAPLYSFVIGLLAYFYLDTIQRRVVSLRATQIIELGAIILISIAGCRKQTAYTILVATICATALISLTAASGRRTLLGIVLDTSVVQFLGKISYSFFLLHMIGLWVAAHILPRMPPLPYVLSGFVVGAAVTVPMAWLLWRFVEVPFILLGRSGSVRATRSTTACSQRS
jgi:peptidoglycan/LPS O-acetylase OafA/YrhL